MKLSKLAAYVTGFLVAAHLAAYLYYVFFDNATNHTGFEVRQYSYMALAFGAVAAVFGFARKKHEWVVVGIISCVLFATLFLLDQFGIMMYYDDWIARGMPDR